MKGKYFRPSDPDIVANHVGDEFVEDLGHRLPAARHQGAAAHRQGQECGDQDHRDHHEKRGIGEGEIDPADFEGDQRFDLELLDRISHRLPLL